VRVSPLISLTPYQGDLDFGTNYMGVKAGGDPNIFETEIHSGLYRGSILIELDRVGCGDGFDVELPSTEKAKRVIGLLNAVKNLWVPGRQSRYLADVSPKFIAAAMMRTKTPIFLESVKVDDNGAITARMVQETIKDYQDEIAASVIGVRTGAFNGEIDGAVTIGDAFNTMVKWVDQYYR